MPYIYVLATKRRSRTGHVITSDSSDDRGQLQST